jgi:pseudaminic acid synthase
MRCALKKKILFNGCEIGAGLPVYFIAEVSANHNQSYERAVEVIKAAKAAGADAIKLQTYTADTITIESDKPYFRVGGGTLWDGATLYELYSEAYTPWDWQLDLKVFTESLGMGFLSTPFDSTAVDFLESIEVQSYKVASSELVDIPLLKCIGATGKPVLLSCGMATLAEIEEAVSTLKLAGTEDIVLLKCTSAYPCPPAEMNLHTLRNMATTFNLPVGLSDHSMGYAAAIAAVSLGACVVEKHLTLRRSDGGPDAAFSMEPEEFAQMVITTRLVETALGTIHYGPTISEKAPVLYRRSLFVCEPIAAGELLTEHNVRSIRPGAGLHTRHYAEIIGRRARKPLEKGTPLSWDMVD